MLDWLAVGIVIPFLSTVKPPLYMQSYTANISQKQHSFKAFMNETFHSKNRPHELSEK